MDIKHAKNIVNISGSCFDHVTPYGEGIWNEKHGETMLRHSFFRLNVQLIVMFVISHLFHLFLKRFHFQRITSDILVTSNTHWFYVLSLTCQLNMIIANFRI